MSLPRHSFPHLIKERQWPLVSVLDESGEVEEEEEWEVKEKEEEAIALIIVIGMEEK